MAWNYTSEDTHAGIWETMRRMGIALDRYVAVPATSSSAGRAGDYAIGNGYLHVCSATNVWLRVEVVSW